jgi:hypothetical protein
VGTGRRFCGVYAAKTAGQNNKERRRRPLGKTSGISSSVTTFLTVIGRCRRNNQFRFRLFDASAAKSAAEKTKKGRIPSFFLALRRA